MPARGSHSSSKGNGGRRRPKSLTPAKTGKSPRSPSGFAGTDLVVADDPAPQGTIIQATDAERERLIATLTAAEIAPILRDHVKDKSYRAFPLGQEAGQYLRSKRQRLTVSSYRDYESGLDKLARYFCDLEISAFEPPVGTERLEEFLDAQWGERAGRTYNKNLSILRDFFRWAVLRGKLHGDPTLAIERARKRAVHRETFSTDQVQAIIAAQEDVRDRTALRLLLNYGLRKGALKGVQFKHFDHNRRRLTIFTKGERVRELPIPQQAFWYDLERLILDTAAQPSHYLLPRQKAIPKEFDPETRKATSYEIVRFPEQPMGDHGLHNWWYRCLERAGIVAEGVTSGERMHKARHTAGQRVLDKTGNLKAAQKLLGHESIQTTADIYTDWDIDQLTETLREVLDSGGEGIIPPA
jgi:site-specific recombinase XerC